MLENINAYPKTNKDISWEERSIACSKRAKETEVKPRIYVRTINAKVLILIHSTFIKVEDNITRS